MSKETLKELALGLVAASWAAIAPIHSILAVVFGLVFLDFVAGVYKNVFIDKQSFSSEKMRHTAIKLVPYLVIILAGFGVDHIAQLDGLWFTRAFALLVSSTEIQSLGEKTGFNLINILRDKLKPPSKEK